MRSDLANRGVRVSSFISLSLSLWLCLSVSLLCLCRLLSHLFIIGIEVNEQIEHFILHLPHPRCVAVDFINHQNDREPLRESLKGEEKGSKLGRKEGRSV